MMAEKKQPSTKPKDAKNVQAQTPTPEEKKGSVRFSAAVPARIEEISGRSGTRGEGTLVRCRVLDGRDKDKVLRRLVRGPVQIDDILMLRETEIEARPLNKAGRSS